jgi:hypothetical protein
MESGYTFDSAAPSISVAWFRRIKLARHHLGLAIFDPDAPHDLLRPVRQRLGTQAINLLPCGFDALVLSFLGLPQLAWRISAIKAAPVN